MMKITGKAVTVRSVEPSLSVYELRIENDSGIWQESFATSGLAQAFLTGVRAGFVMAGRSAELPNCIFDLPQLIEPARPDEAS